MTYWSCSKFADWLRGTPKDYALSADDWNIWHKKAATKHPIRYWLAEDGLDHIEGFLTWPQRQFRYVKNYINNRWIYKSNSLTAHKSHIRPGHWCDLGNRFLPCMFNELVDFVEIELAGHNITLDREARKKFRPPWYYTAPFSFFQWRCPAAGLDHLNWAANLKKNEDWGIEPDDKEYNQPTPQAEMAKEVLELYHWWKTVYLNRPDPYEISGWTSYCNVKRQRAEQLRGSEKSFFSLFTTDPDLEIEQKLEEQSKKALILLDEIEQKYEAEDTEMIIRLIKIRHYLWC